MSALASLGVLLGTAGAAAADSTYGPAAAVDPATNSQFVFWRGQDGDLSESYYNGQWRGPVDVTAAAGLGPATAAPAVAVGDDGQQFLFWQAASGTLTEGHYTNHWARDSFPTWGAMASAPAVAVDPRNDDQYVYWLGTDGYIHEGWYHGGWHGPVTMTSWGKASTGPSVAVGDDDQQFVFWRGSDGTVYEAHYGATWSVHRFSAWQAASTPAVAVNPANDEQYVYWQGSNGDLQEAWFQGTWHGPVTMSSWGAAASAPAVAVGENNAQYVFWKSPAGGVEEAYHSTGWSLASYPSWTPGGSLSAQELAGERVVFSYSGLTPPSSLYSAIKAGEVAGVVFFADNISSQSQIRRVIATLQQAAMQSPVKEPLLMMTDQEGGEVRRLPGAPTMSEKQIGASANPAAAATSAGQGAGTNLKGAGMNVNLAPVLDVYRSPGDFDDQYGRSYSSNPAVVQQLGADFIKAQQATGVAATAKHFPGLGAATASQNTDQRPVTLNVSLSSLRSIDERPYTSAIAAGSKLVMVSWAVYPALDAHRPAGLSSTIVQGELRGRLGFRGVTVTDALEAGALQAFGTTANRALLAAGAGMDLLLCSSGNVSQGTSAVSALASALTSAKLSRADFVAASNRVTALRQGFGG